MPHFISRFIVLSAVLTAVTARADTAADLQATDPATLKPAIDQLAQAWPGRYDSSRHRIAVETLAKERDALLEAVKRGDAAATARADRLVADARAALLDHPALRNTPILLVRRATGNLGLPHNWEGNCSLPRGGFDNEIVVLDSVTSTGALRTLYRPDRGAFVGDVDLDFDASRMVFSSISTNGRWRIFELPATGGAARELPLIPDADIDNYDPCYLPDGNLLFTSTAPFVGVPCVQGSAHVANLFRWDRDGGAIRRLTFEQDHNWCPTVLDDGRILYLRWEYSDIPHFVSRILFTMNPDGTAQREFYGSNSYWPNSMFYARPLPGSISRFVAVVSGHHDTTRTGELVVFDNGRGRREAEGAVQRIPGRGKPVEPVIRDGLVGASWPKFLHPWPLDDTFFLVAMQPAAKEPWGLYLVDTFDNLIPIRTVPGSAMLEPIPLVARAKPPAPAQLANTNSPDATVYIADLYAGPGLDGVPRGTVKSLRLFTYQFAYHGMGGQVNRVGLDGPWDIKSVLGTVPVEADGSAHFHVPANTPISIQPLDTNGAALQLMRSWMTAMPGERVSCVGCHETQNSSPILRTTLAAQKAPATIADWHGPVRGFSFRREVQPVLDRFCVSCHGGKDAPDLRDGPDVKPTAQSDQYNNGTKFSPSYLALRAFVRSPTIESDMHILKPREFGANATALIQLLKRGHHGVSLDAEAWDRLQTWIDLNTPAHGTWREIVGDKAVDHQRDRRLDLMKRYGGPAYDPEAIPAPVPAKPVVVPAAEPAPAAVPTDWAFDATEAGKKQVATGYVGLDVLVGGAPSLYFVPVPAGSFVMGDAAEGPATKVEIKKSFWMSRFEISNAQYAQFDPAHDSGIEAGDFLQFSERERGYRRNETNQPVASVSWLRAMDFCRWLSAKSGKHVTLPTEAQWEWACRAGTATAMSFGGLDADFTPYANLADKALRLPDTFGWGLPSGAIPPWRPAAEQFNDHFHVAAPVGKFKPNAWGLHDLHGNVAEWTRSAHRPYPYRDDDGRNADLENASAERVVRGGSWYDRPQFARSAARLSYPAWQRVYNVGFRVVVEE